MPEEYGEYINLDSMHYAIVTDSKDAYTPGVNNYLAPAGQISHEPSTKINTRYYDGIAMFTTTTEGETKVALTVSGVPLPIAAILTGKYYDESKGLLVDTGDTRKAPWCALSGRMELGDDAFRYFQYLKGKFSLGKMEAESRKDDISPKTTELTYTAVTTLKQFTVNGEQKGIKGLFADDSDPAFTGADSWFTQVQTPDTVSAPAALILSTSNPLDGATAVAVSLSPTLTFTNEIESYAVTLINPTALTVVPAAFSLDAAGKILTINPDADLAAATKYAIVITKAKDIFGQELDNTIIDFTTV